MSAKGGSLDNAVEGLFGRTETEFHLTPRKWEEEICKEVLVQSMSTLGGPSAG